VPWCKGREGTLFPCGRPCVFCSSRKVKNSVPYIYKTDAKFCEISSSHGGEYDVHICLVIALMMEAARTSETSDDNYFTRQYIPQDKSELQMQNYCHRKVVLCVIQSHVGMKMNRG
jgi:hypothetical protein